VHLSKSLSFISLYILQKHTTSAVQYFKYVYLKYVFKIHIYLFEIPDIWIAFCILQNTKYIIRTNYVWAGYIKRWWEALYFPVTISIKGSKCFTVYILI